MFFKFTPIPESLHRTFADTGTTIISGLSWYTCYPSLLTDNSKTSLMSKNVPCFGKWPLQYLLVFMIYKNKLKVVQLRVTETECMRSC